MGVVDLAFLRVVSPGDLTFAPASDGSGTMNIYIADRGIDNNDDPNENDGKIYEITLVEGPPPNRLKNPAFELDADGDALPDTWSVHPGFMASSEPSFTGGFAGRFMSTDNTSVNTRQAIYNVTPGPVEVSCWVNIPPSDDLFKFVVDVQWHNAERRHIRTDIVKTFRDDTNSRWKQATPNSALTAPFGTVRATMRLSAGSLLGRIYVDDCIFRQLAD